MPAWDDDSDSGLSRAEFYEGDFEEDDPTICEACGDWTPCDCDVQLMIDIEGDGSDEN